jgi:pSer/pThr/pTyr-binding forkhead associated (FHA) protein
MAAAIAKLVSTADTILAHEVVLRKFPLRLGRNSTADVCIRDRWVSREHCEIDRCPDGLVVRDLGSKHGTYLNGVPVTNARLEAGDELVVGLTRFVVQCDGVPNGVPLGEVAFA